MFVVVILRNGETHIVNYVMNNNKGYRTICSKTISKNPRVNTLAADNTFPGICQTCKAHYDEMYLDDLNGFTAMARNQTQDKYPDLVELHRYGCAGPQVENEDNLGRRWYKLIKYQRLLQKR